jgi:hypothetical protein
MSAGARLVDRKGETFTLVITAASGSEDDYGDDLGTPGGGTAIKGFRNPGVGRENSRMTIRGVEYFIDMSVIVRTSDATTIPDAPTEDYRATITDAWSNTWEVVAVGRAGNLLGFSRLMCVQKTGT